MKWLKRKVIKWVHEDWNSPPDNSTVDSAFGSKLGVSIGPRAEPAVSFKLYSATNGQVLEFSKYDPRTDRNDVSIYIIDKDKDVGEFVSKCVNLELLK
jgi:hypothetical protein